MRRALFLAALLGTAAVPGGAAPAPEAGDDVAGQIQALAASGGASLVLEPRAYRLPPGGLKIDGLHDATIDGNGATLLAANPAAPALELTRCRNVVFRNLTVDYDPLPFTQATVTAVDPAAGTVDFALHAGYPDLVARATAAGSPALLLPRLHLFDGTSHRWKIGAPDYAPRRVEKTGPRTGRAFFEDMARGLDKVAVGDRIALDVLGPAAVSVREECRDLRFEDVAVHASPGLAFMIRSAWTAGYYRVKVVPGPVPAGAAEPRLISTNADGFNAALVRQGPTLEDCEFAYQGDDGVNLHGVMFPVLKRLGDGAFLSMLPTKRNRIDQIVQPGDEARFVRPPDYAVVATAHIRSVAIVPEDPAPWMEAVRRLFTAGPVDPAGSTFYRIELDQPVAGAMDGTFAEVPAVAAPGFAIRNCSFHDHRGRGLRIMASDGVIEGNRFERIKGAGISLGAEMAYWREPGWPERIAVRNNHLCDVAQGAEVLLPSSYTLGAISLFARLDPGAPPGVFYPGIRDIAIEGNEIDGCGVGGISICAARNVTVAGNTVRNTGLAGSAAARAGSLLGLRPGGPVTVLHAEATVDGVPVSNP